MIRFNQNYKKMKFIYITLSLLPIVAIAQVKIGDTTPVTSSVIFQVGNLSSGVGASESSTNINTTGFILPTVAKTVNTESTSSIDLSNSSNLGTLFFDAKDKQVKYIISSGKLLTLSDYIDNGININTDYIVPIDLKQGNISRIIDAFGVANIQELESFATTNESTTPQGVIIGSETSSAQGALILESSDKGFVLPHIYQAHLKVINPYPGFMCYDTQRGTLAVFDGNNWHYWK